MTFLQKNSTILQNFIQISICNFPFPVLYLPIMRKLIYANLRKSYSLDLPFNIRNTIQCEMFEPHTHDYVEIVMVYQGRGLHIIHSADGTTIPNPIIKGDIFTVLPGEIHSYTNCVNSRVYNICISLELLEEFRKNLAEMEYFDTFFNFSRPFRINQLHLAPGEFKNAESILRTLIPFLSANRPCREFASKVKLLDFLLTIFNGDIKGIKNTGTAINERLFQSIAKLEAHPEQKWDISKALTKPA